MAARTIASDQKRDVSKRKQFIEQTLRLNHDPFAFATAELELQVQPEDPPFFSYFVQPPTVPPQENLLEHLRQANPVFIFGAAGSGKTTLRYALEALCRAVPDGTLVVSYTLGKTEAPSSGETAVWRSLTESLATDLFVQVMEQLHTIREPDPDVVQRLGQFWHGVIPHYGRNLRRHLEQNKTNTLTGISPWWTTWKRAAVRYTPLTPKRQSFLQQLLTLQETTPPAEVHHGELFYQGAALAAEIGFRQIYLLVDVVDSSQQRQLHLEEHLSQLLPSIHDLSPPIPLYPKLFLPEHWQDHVNHLATALGWLTPQTLSAIIRWDQPEALHALIANRFRSAGSWIRGFNTIAGQEIADRLDEMMIQTADNSPRRLLQTASLLIDAHVMRQAEEPLLTAVDWNAMCQMWSYESPPSPLPLITSRQTGENR